MPRNIGGPDAPEPKDAETASENSYLEDMPTEAGPSATRSGSRDPKPPSVSQALEPGPKVADAPEPAAVPVRDGTLEPEVVDQPTYIEPSFDIRELHRKLCSPFTTDKEKIAGLLGLHIRFWHASAQDMRRMLYRVGHCKAVVALVDKVVQSCPECAAYARKLTKPLIRMRLAEHFNLRVQTDLFFL